MCTDGQPRTHTDGHGRPVCCRTHTDVLCVLTDTHGCPVCADGHPRTSCPTWAKITRIVHRKGQHSQSKDQRADMCTDGQPWMSSTDVLCVLTDRHRRPVCVLTDTHGHPLQPTWAKITRTVHGKGQRAESKDQRADMCTVGQPQTSCVC
ncbi:unnamed protein product [Brassica rapa]|uniref:Uncharacterized protein n=1 Tax=Brassica campestris TaxID=3711 RepID=A0A8D9CU69_BRACM|nr:unnamed protein product [Brassica rapa]